MTKQPHLVLLLVCLLISLTGCQDSSQIAGVIEADVNAYYSEVSGKIVELPVALGQDVKQGDTLAVIDSGDAQYNLEQAQQELRRAQSALAQLSKANEPEYVQQCRNQVTVAEQNYKNTDATYQRQLNQYEQQQVLYEAGAVPADQLEEMAYQLSLTESSRVSAEAQLDSARQQLVLAQKQMTTDEQITMAEVDVQRAQNQVDQLTRQLEKYTIRAGCDGKILSLSYNQGALVTAGSPFVDIAVDDVRYWVGYVPVEYLNQLDCNKTVAIATDSMTEMALVTYLDGKSQYAPKDYQTSSNRNQTTVKVKCKLPDGSALQAGESAMLRLDNASI